MKLQTKNKKFKIKSFSTNEINEVKIIFSMTNELYEKLSEETNKKIKENCRKQRPNVIGLNSKYN